YQREVRTQLAQTQMDVNDYKNKLDMANFDLGNTEIISPVDGTVVGLNIFTRGGVVGAGDHLMDVVPSETPEGAKMLQGEEIKPGMPVEVFVKTGSRSLLSYLFKPI
ncbi:hemolysin D, partial [Klebsiella aerogenes]